MTKTERIRDIINEAYGRMMKRGISVHWAQVGGFDKGDNERERMNNAQARIITMGEGVRLSGPTSVAQPIRQSSWSPCPLCAGTGRRETPKI